MARDSGGGRKPSERPTKLCPVCQKPFAWRKAWKRDWESVIYCSERCRNNRHLEPGPKLAVKGH